MEHLPADGGQTVDALSEIDRLGGQKNAAFWGKLDHRSGPQILDTGLSEISMGSQAATFAASRPKYTASGVRRCIDV